MPSIEDWAAKAARKIRGEHRGCKEGPTQERVAAIIATFAKPILNLLAESRREHDHCDDSWYCCGKCRHSDHYLADGEWLGEGANGRTGGECTCGADAWNARVDQALDG